MKLWEWYQRIVLGVIALMLVLIVLRLYASPTFFADIYRLNVRSAIPVYVGGGSVDVEVTNTPRVEVTNTPLEVEVIR